MESEESQISVWVGREEKLVLGLSKRTSCADVVAVLLEEQRAQHRLSAAHSYCIVEKWRGFERILPHKTRILRLWLAWGDERKDVKFVLVKSDASLASPGARSAEARVVRSRQSPREAKGSARGPAVDISAEKQRRVVRKAFRKLEKMNKRRARAAHPDASSAERMETLVHLVVSQDHTIRQQVQRIGELDAEIERREAQVHFDRMKRHGVNYVQDTYLAGAAAASGRPEDGARSAETLAKLEAHAARCEEVVRLQEELREQEALTDILSGQIQEELNRRWMRRRREKLRGSEARAAGHELLLEEEDEEERIRTQLDASLYIGLRLDTDLEAVAGDLGLIQELCAAREQEIRELLEEVEALEADEGRACEETGVVMLKSAWVEQARGLSKAHSVNDDDSDTGLSSLHSQDSDSQPVWESLV